jgi:menaquinol-cytochrome c reductase iron-sulfur subunit
MAEAGQARRGFLKAATVALGGAIGAVLAYPLVRYLLHPVGRRVVSDPGEPIDIGPADALVPGAAPVRVQLSADRVRDAWALADDVPLGAAWVRRTENGDVQAFTQACPHLGCAIEFDGGEGVFKCPCHRSAFGLDGEKITGPSKRGLDPLPVKVEDGRVKLTFIRFKTDIAGREPA